MELYKINLGLFWCTYNGEFPMVFPPRYHLDDKSCEKKNCGKCVEACNYDAINLGATETVREIKVGSVLFCTGWQPYDTGQLDEFSFGKSPDILTNMMMGFILVEWLRSLLTEKE